MKKILLIISLLIGLFSYSQIDDHLFWLEGRILESDQDTITCDIYAYDKDIDDFVYVISYEYSGSYAVSFDYEEYFVLVFSDSNSKYFLHIPVEKEGYKLLDIGLDVTTKAMLDSSSGKYILKLLE